MCVVYYYYEDELNALCKELFLFIVAILIYVCSDDDDS